MHYTSLVHFVVNTSSYKHYICNIFCICCYISHLIYIWRVMKLYTLIIRLYAWYILHINYWKYYVSVFLLFLLCELNIENYLKTRMKVLICLCDITIWKHTHRWPGFSKSYVVVLFCVTGLRSEVIARFDDIGGIVDRHCVSFFNIIQSNYLKHS